MSKNLNKAKKNKQDEFYTLYEDIEKELAYYEGYFKGKVVLLPCDDPDKSNFTKYFLDNFDRLKLKKLVSTCYTPFGFGYQPSLFENLDGLESKGKILIKTKDNIIKDKLKSSGDFRSKEVTKLRNECDIIVTNPPFSLFREFIDWVKCKKFLVLGNVLAVIYINVFPLIKENKVRLGVTIRSGVISFQVPDNYPLESYTGYIDELGNKYIRVKGVRWYTNLEHRYIPPKLELNTMEHNQVLYEKYDNYDALEVPKVELIPSDYEGVMGVPITFMDKYNPEQFEILGSNRGKVKGSIYGRSSYINGVETFRRLFIKHKKV